MKMQEKLEKLLALSKKMYSETKPWHQITEEEREGKAFLNLKSLMDLHSEIDDCVKTWKIKIHEL